MVQIHCGVVVTLLKLGLALFQMPNNKCSGTDGILLDFYKKSFGIN